MSSQMDQPSRRFSTITIGLEPLFFAFLFSLFFTLCSGSVLSAPAITTKAAIDQHWATKQESTNTSRAEPFLVPLGSMKKSGGVWLPENFDPIVGEIDRTTWSVKGQSVLSLYEQFNAQMSSQLEPAWQCEGRSCGNGSEWASRVYGERLLYGRDEFMRYSAFKTESGVWITLFCAARTADRQYLHLDIVTPD